MSKRFTEYEFYWFTFAKGHPIPLRREDGRWWKLDGSEFVPPDRATSAQYKFSRKPITERGVYIACVARWVKNSPFSHVTMRMFV